MAFSSEKEIREALDQGYEIVYRFRTTSDYEDHSRLFKSVDDGKIYYTFGNLVEDADACWNLDFKESPGYFTKGILRGTPKHIPQNNRFVKSLNDQDCKCTKCGDAVFMAGKDQVNFVCYTCRNRF